MQVADNLTSLTRTQTLQQICGSKTGKTDRHPTEDEVTLRPSDQHSHRGALGFFPGTGSRGISQAKCLRGVVALLKDRN